MYSFIVKDLKKQKADESQHTLSAENVKFYVERISSLRKAILYHRTDVLPLEDEVV